MRALDKATAVKPAAVPVSISKVKPAGMKPVPLMEKSRFGKKLSTGKPITCIELTPPRGVDADKVIDSAKLCAKHGIDAINIP
ncbi:MAG: bifunctional homocysteine S-methyltransferase/methylenetetrahydrofolate reductase, partial [Planctomycetota bacterium]